MTADRSRTPQAPSRICKFARMGPRKLRRVADAIRGKSVREALVLLQVRRRLRLRADREAARSRPSPTRRTTTT